MDAYCSSGTQTKTMKGFTQRHRNRKAGKDFPAGMVQKHHTVFNRHPDSKRQSEAG